MKSLVIVGVDMAALVVTGFCSMILWNWFVPATFASAPRLTFGAAMGVVLLASCLVASGKQYRAQEILDTGTVDLLADAMLTSMMNSMIKPVTLLFFGWIVQAIVY
jgi:hypothetical protein